MLFLYINIGSLAAFGSTAVEKKYGFPAAFALPTVVFFIGLVIALASKNKYVSHPPSSSIILNVCRVVWIAAKHKGDLNYARPNYYAEGDPTRVLPWNDSFIDDLRSALSSCKLFLFYPFYWAAYSQLLTNFISQAATMKTNGIPNDMMTYIDPVMTLILLPILDRAVFPFLRRLGMPVRHVDRMATGFIISGCAMLYATYIQQAIYSAPPCYSHPRAADCLGGKYPNRVSVLLQIPAYVLIAASEVLASVAAVEYAYTRAPKSMKSLIMAVYLSTFSAGMLLAALVLPLTVDPKLTWMYFTLAIETLVAGTAIWFVPI